MSCESNCYKNEVEQKKITSTPRKDAHMVCILYYIQNYLAVLALTCPDIIQLY